MYYFSQQPNRIPTTSNSGGRNYSASEYHSGFDCGRTSCYLWYYELGVVCTFPRTKEVQAHPQRPMSNSKALSANGLLKASSKSITSWGSGIETHMTVGRFHTQTT